MAISGISGSSVTSVRQTDVSKARQGNAAKLLKEMDSDGSGAISKQEFTAFGEKMKAQRPRGPEPSGGTAPNGGTAPTMPSADELFSGADKNADDSLSVDELSSMMAQAETRRASAGGASEATGGAGKARPPGGHGGAPPVGGKGGGGGIAGASSTKSGSSSSSSATEPADTNKDGTVSASEKLIYELSHPTAATEVTS